MTSKRALLTIDDAPSPRMREKVDFLTQNGIRAVWFCNGLHLEARPELALYALERGQILGNHAYEHPRFSELSLEEGFGQIERTEALLEGLYQRAGLARPGKYFRFPYGDKGGVEKRAAYQAFLAKLGFAGPPRGRVTYEWFWRSEQGGGLDWLWTYDTKDWALNRLEPVEGLEDITKIFARMDLDLPAEGCGLNRAGSDEIVLMHDHERTTGQFLAILQRLMGKVDFHA